MMKLFAFISVVALVTGVAFAADEDSSKMLEQAYAVSKNAKTAEQFTELIDACHKVQKQRPRKELDDYAKQLLAWAHNRRGEIVSERAGELAAKKDERSQREAAELDEQALADFEEAVANDPGRWKALHNRGVSYALKRKYEDSLKDFEQVTSLKPDYANAWFNRAEILFELRRYREAIENYDETLKLDQNDTGALTNRGRSLMKLGQSRDAIRDFDQVIGMTSDNAAVYVYRGEAYQTLGQWDKAREDLLKSIETDPENGHAYLATAWLVSTCPDEKFRNAEMAIQSVDKALKLDGDNSYEYWDTYAAALANATRYPDAKKAIAKAMTLAPAEEVAKLKKRQDLYGQSKPYRQEVAAARTTKSPSKR